MDERGHGCGARHRVGQPDVQRELRALADRADEQQRGRRGRNPERQRRDLERLEAHLARVEVDDEDTDEEPEVPDAVDDECLPAGVRLRVVVVPEPDEQIAAEPDALPADEHRDQVVRQHEQQHRGDEKVQVREVPPVRRVLVHVPDGVQMDEEADAGHDENECSREPIEREPEIDAQAAGGEPRVDELAELRHVTFETRDLHPGEHAHAEREQHDHESDRVHPRFGQPTTR